MFLWHCTIPTYFSLAWLSEGTTAPFPLAYILEAGFDTFYSVRFRHLSKKATTYDLHSYTAVVFSLSLSHCAPVSFFSSRLHPSSTLPIRTGAAAVAGSLKPSVGDLFFQSLFQGFIHAPPVIEWWGLLKGIYTFFGLFAKLNDDRLVSVLHSWAWRPTWMCAGFWSSTALTCLF